MDLIIQTLEIYNGHQTDFELGKNNNNHPINWFRSIHQDIYAKVNPLGKVIFNITRVIIWAIVNLNLALLELER